MKNIIRLIKKRLFLLIISPILWVGCENILIEEPYTFLSEDAVFASEEGIVSATMGVYQSLRGNRNYYEQLFYAVTVAHADYGLGRGSFVAMGNYQLDAQNIGRIGNLWAAIYSSINRANVVIHNMPNVTGISQELKNQLEAEVLFLRALGYYNLVRLFGDVPLRLEPEAIDFAMKRTPSEEVYAQIITDLQFCENNLPVSYPPSELGRITRWAAKSLLADVYLTLGRWSESATKAKEVIDSKQFSLVNVNTSDDFNSKIFGIDIPTHSEEILSIKYSIERNNDQFVRFFHRNPNYAFGTPHALIANPKSFIGKGEWENENSPDLRRNNTLYSGADTSYLDAAIPMLFRKFRGTKTNVSNDTPLLRYPEVLLIFAEADNQANGGPTDAAYEALNQVRRRAFGKIPEIPNEEVDYPKGMTGEEFREVVLMERAKEFVTEGKRWFDLLRTNTAIEVIQPLGLNISEKNLKLPISQIEIDNNDALTNEDQNPGW